MIHDSLCRLSGGGHLVSLYGCVYRGLWRLRAGQMGRELFGETAAMIARERLSADEQGSYQLDRLRALLCHAYSHVPFWRARMEIAGLNPKVITSLEDLSILPLLTKGEVEANSQALIADTHRNVRLIANATGGSTGEPVHFWQDLQYVIVNRAAKLRYRRWYGYDFGERVAYLWGARRDTKVHGMRVWLRRQLRQEQWVSAFHLGPSELLGLADLLNHWQPRLLVAYPSALHAFARFVLQRGLHVRSPGAVECSAEKLWPEQRQEIERALGVPLFDVYGSREFGAIAAECPAHQGLHLFTDNHVIEVLRNGRSARPGDVGEIVITCLDNYAMPFIRYRTGDLGVLADRPCSCGRTLPLLAQVIGRTNAVVSLPGGRLVHGAFFSYFFYHQSGVHRYQVQQPDYHEIQVLLMGDDTLTPERLEAMSRSLAADLGNRITVTVNRVPRIDPLPSGKLGYLTSKVPVDFTCSSASTREEEGS